MRRILDNSGEEYITELLNKSYKLKGILDKQEEDLKFIKLNDLGYINRQLKELGYKTRKEGDNITVGNYIIKTIKGLKLEYDLSGGEIVSRAMPLLYEIEDKEDINITNFTRAELVEDLKRVMN